MNENIQPMRITVKEVPLNITADVYHEYLYNFMDLVEHFNLQKIGQLKMCNKNVYDVSNNLIPRLFALPSTLKHIFLAGMNLNSFRCPFTFAISYMCLSEICPLITWFDFELLKLSL